MSGKQVRELALYILAAVIVVSAIGFLMVLATRETPVANKDAILLALGALLTAFGTVINYFFGSSKGSADKTDAMTAKTPP